MMSGDRLQNTAQEDSGLQRTVIPNSNVMHSSHSGGEPDMGAVLPHGLIAEYPQRTHQVGRIDIARDLHTANASSRTKCSRMIFGIGPGIPSLK